MRSKNLHLHHLHYITSTNMSFCQSNITYLTGKKGTGYHWMLDLLALDGVQEALAKANQVRKQKLEMKGDEAKRRRLKWKNARDLEQEERKQRVQHRQQAIRYGSFSLSVPFPLKLGKKLLCEETQLLLV